MTAHLPDECVRMRTERLLLRPVELQDVDDIYAYASDPEFGRYLPVPRPYTYSDAAKYVAQQVLSEWTIRPHFAIVLNGRVIGGTGLRISERDQIGELGYAIARTHWGMGITTEASRAVMDWGFRKLALHKVFARADLRNMASWRVMEKLGMTREGVLRSHTRLGDEHFDDVYYGILRDEWQQTIEG